MTSSTKIPFSDFTSTTYVLKASTKDRFGRLQELYWDGQGWTPQMWDAAHFDEKIHVESFIRENCGPALKGGWSFYIMPVDFGG